MTYVPPECEILEFAREDLITTSILNLPLFPFPKRYSASMPFPADENDPLSGGDGYWY